MRNLCGLLVGLMIGAWSHRTFSAVLPEGAVIAFDSANCPSGWSSAGLNGKFIVGATTGELGGGAFPYGSTGGTSSVTLSVANLPAHSHNYESTGTWSPRLRLPGGGSSGLTFTSGTGADALGSTSTMNTGSGTAFSNLPPYQAFRYCRLDADLGDGMDTVGVLGISPGEAINVLVVIGIVAVYALGFVVGQQR